MHSAGNLELWIKLVRASSSRANKNSLGWWESPHGVDSIFFTVEGKRSCLCMEMDTAGMVTALVHLGDSYGYACHVAYIDIQAVEAVIDFMAGNLPALEVA